MTRPVHRPYAPDAPIPGVHHYSGCDPDHPTVSPDGVCTGCGELACPVCGLGDPCECRRPDPRPAKRIKATADEWVKLRAEKLGPCRLCHTHDSPTLHHILSKSLGGDDLAANLVPLCGSGTTGCHGKVEARDPWARTLLGERLKAAELAYVIGKKGAGWLAIHYGVKERKAA